MSVEDKTRFVNSLKNKLSNLLTVNEMNELISILTVEIANYDMLLVNRNGNTDDMLSAFINALRVEGRSKKTLERYKYIIGKMLKRINIPTCEITVFDVRKYLAEEKERGISDRTLEGNRQIFSSYFGWLHREGMIKSNPIANIGAIKHQKKVYDVFSDTDIELMKRSCKNDRDLAIITLLFSTGCRISELTGLNRSDINLTTLECKVKGKGNKERVVFLDEITGMFLRKYLAKRTDDNDALFVSRLKTRITNGSIRLMLKNIEASSGVNNIHPHKFRRTLATNLIRRGMPIANVAVLLGHDKIDTTMQYVVLDKSDIENAYRRFV